MAKKPYTRENSKKQAVEGKRLNAFAVDPNDLIVIGLDSTDGPEHPLYDERIKLPLEDSLVLNIRALGVIEPVIIKKDGERLLVVDGRRRVLHARQANLLNEAQGLEPISVPVMLRRGADESLMGVMISLNEQRRGDEIATKLSKLERYLALGKTEEEAAIMFGVSATTIKNWLALLEAGPAVKKAFTSGQLSASAATKLAKLPRVEQAEAVKQATADGAKPTAAQAGRVAKAAKTEGGLKFEPAITPPSKKLIKAVLEELTAGRSQLGHNGDRHFGFSEALSWVLGLQAADQIPALPELLGELATKKSKRKTKAVSDEPLEDTENDDREMGVEGYAGEELHAAGEVDEEEMELYEEDRNPPSTIGEPRTGMWDEDPALSEQHA